MGVIDYINKIAKKKVADTRVIIACTTESLGKMDSDYDGETNVKEFGKFNILNIYNIRFRDYDYTDEELIAMYTEILKKYPRKVTEVTK